MIDLLTKKITIMIQTKTLKEALKDPGVIEVVEELIGTATWEKDGLMSKTANFRMSKHG